MATLLLPDSCRYLLDHPDRGGGKGAGAMLRTPRLLAAGVAAKRSISCVRAAWSWRGNSLPLARNPSARGARASSSSCAGEMKYQKKNYQKKERKSLHLGKREVFPFGSHLQGGKRKKSE